MANENIKKCKEWNTVSNWLLMLGRGIVLLLLTVAINQYSRLANEVRKIKTDVAVMKGNRFTSGDGELHDRRITVLETKLIGMREDIKEIKTDVKILIRSK